MVPSGYYSVGHWFLFGYLRFSHLYNMHIHVGYGQRDLIELESHRKGVNIWYSKSRRMPRANSDNYNARA